MTNQALTRWLLPLAIAALISSCKTQSYYVSPALGNNHYVTQPLQNGDEKSAFYANGSFTTGLANEYLRDAQYSFQANAYNVHQFSLFKGWYGGGLSLGSYEVGYSSLLINYAGERNINGKKFYGTANLEGGMSFVWPFRYGEWRVIGVSGNLYNEFGNYLSFRKSVNKDSVSGVATSATLGSLGFSSEFVGKLRRGEIGYAIQYNTMLGPQYSDLDFGKGATNAAGYHRQRYGYFATTFHVTINRATYYTQANVGNRILSFQCGINYKISSTNKKHTSPY